MRIIPSFQNFRGDDRDIFSKPDFSSKNWVNTKEDINSLWKLLMTEKNDTFERFYDRDREDTGESDKDTENIS
jgi:hypothetical protein